MANVLTAWLIESENGMYIGIGFFGSFGWISDVHKAIRFCRKEDAEITIAALKKIGIGFHEQAKGATEHGFDE